jgi:tetratricopeptide (TPR) repeat protein
MSQSRIDAFTTMTSQQPDNEMIWYGLANEYSKLARWSEAAEALRQVIRIKPDYTAAYQLLGSALLSQGDHEGARRVWTQGIEVATRTGAWKARQHMEGLLAGTGAESDPGLCQE